MTERITSRRNPLLEQVRRLDTAALRRKAGVFLCDSPKLVGEAVQHGFARAMWCGDDACELEVKNRFNAKTRNMPFDQTPIGDTCVVCGKKATKLIYFGKQY